MEGWKEINLLELIVENGVELKDGRINLLELIVENGGGLKDGRPSCILPVNLQTQVPFTGSP